MNTRAARNECCICFRFLCRIVAVLLTVAPGFCVELFACDKCSPGATSTQQPAAQAQEPTTPGRTKVAEGEYRVLGDSGIGSFDPAVYGFKESWTLSRLEDGTFEVEGTREYRSPADEAHSDNFEVHLSDTFRVLKVTEFRKLRWRPNSGPLTCDFLPGKVACTANSRDQRPNLSMEVPVQCSAGLLWPISAFSLSSITRGASHDPKTITPVELFTFDETSGPDPVFAMTLGGHLRYLGQEKLLSAGREWLADKFELKVAMHLPFLLWTSPQGLLLAVAYETKSNKMTDDAMILAIFHQWQDF